MSIGTAGAGGATVDMKLWSPGRCRRAVGTACASLLTVGAFAGVPAPLRSSGVTLVRASSATPHFPLYCRTIITTSQISRILRRRVTTGRVNDLDPKSSTCWFSTFAKAQGDLYVEVDAYPTDYSALKKKYPGHEIATLNGLGTHVAVITGKNQARVVAFFGSWLLDVAGGTNKSTHVYKAPQILAIAARAYKSIVHRKALVGPSAP